MSTLRTLALVAVLGLAYGMVARAGFATWQRVAQPITKALGGQGK